MTEDLKEKIREDDRFFAAQLDLIPRALLVPKTDETRQAHYEKIQERRKLKKLKKQLKKQQKNGKASAELDDDNEDKSRNSKNKRTFTVRSNEEALAEATKEQQQMERAFNWQTPNSSRKANGVKETKSEASLEELRERLKSKIESERKKGGTPGARAERDKLLPPKPPRPARAESEPKAEESTTEDVRLEQKKSKKEELEAKLTFGLLKVEKPKKAKDIPDKPQRSATSTNSIINVKKLIKQAEKSQARVDALRAEGRDDVVADQKWDILERKAAGEKIRDDPKLLKKALKRLEKQKQKAGKEWEERKQRENEAQGDREAEKAKHVADRKAKKIEKRGGTVQKKESEEPKKRRRPGFEGAASRLNSKSPGKQGENKGSAQATGDGGKKRNANAHKSPFAGTNKKPRTET